MAEVTEPKVKQKKNNTLLDMPKFILLASDKLAAPLIVRWIIDAMAAGVNEEKLESARKKLAEFRVYKPTRLPD